MIIVLIHWQIKQNSVDEFLEFWRKGAIVQDRTGLVGEFLSEIGSKSDFPYITWNISARSVEGADFVNVGLWADEGAFAEQIGKYFNDEAPLKDFEQARRVRTVLRPKCWRVGDARLPEHDSEDVL